MITAGDFKKGITVEMDNGVWTIVDFQHVKPGKGAAFVRTRIKNVMTGAVLERTFNPTDKMPKAIIETKEMQYTYNDGEFYHFMDLETYDDLMLTHDQVEAMSMADTIILMDHGEIQQIGSPEEIYRNPANLFVAQFIGSPAMNIVKKEDCTIGFRPEAVCLTKEHTNAAFSVPGTISTREMLGRETNYSIRDRQGNTYMVTSPMDDWRPQQQVYLNVERASLYVFGKNGNRLPQMEGAVV